MRAVVAVTGPRAGGKTRALLGLAARLATAGLRVDGVVQPAIHQDGARIGYDLLDVATGARRPLARRAVDSPGAEGGFTFAPDAWPWAAARLQRARRTADVLVVDELGRLEATGAGHLPALLAPVAGEHARVWLVGVRAAALEPLTPRLGGLALVVEVPLDLDLVAARLHRLAVSTPSPKE